MGIVSERRNDDEKIYDADGMEIIVSEDLDGAIKGAEIDYVSGWLKKGFEVTPTFS